MNTFLQTLDSQLAADDELMTKTENGAGAFMSSGSRVLDLFANGAALRARTEVAQAKIFVRAWQENPVMALRVMFYIRDVREGQGQRAAFRVQLIWLAHEDAETVRQNLFHIPEYGRWDDLYALVGTPVEADVFDLMHQQFLLDMESETPSLLAKWLKSENASNHRTKQLAAMTRKAFGLSSKEYRQSLSALREKLDVLERKMSANQWDAIEYSAVPSQALLRSRKAFNKRDGERFQEHIEAVLEGKATVNAGTLYPHQIIEKMAIGFGYATESSMNISVDEAQALWDSLPNYVDPEECGNVMVVVDVSASMMGTPLNVAVALGLYFSERNTGGFKDICMTFSEQPQLIYTGGDKTITEKVLRISRSDWGMSTNLEAVFKEIFKAASHGDVLDEDLPTKVIIISDMEFNCVMGGTDMGTHERIQQMCDIHGVAKPDLLFWNVDCRNDHVPVQMDEFGTQLVSGFSPTILKHVLSGAGETPLEMMERVMSDPRYGVIEIAA